MHRHLSSRFVHQSSQVGWLLEDIRLVVASAPAFRQEIAMPTSLSTSYTTEALARALTPVKTVIDSFVNDMKRQPSAAGVTISSQQEQFVSLLLSISRGTDATDNPTNDVDAVDW